jgi:CRP-like cAMP-binding protein
VVVEVMEDVLTCSLSIPYVKDLLNDNIEFGKSITNLMSFKYKKMQPRLESLFFKNTPERIKGFIKEMQTIW